MKLTTFERNALIFDDDYGDRHKWDRWWHECLLYNRWGPFGHNRPLSNSIHDDNDDDGDADGNDDNNYDDHDELKQ